MHSQKQQEPTTQIQYSLKRPSLKASRAIKENYFFKGLNKAICALSDYAIVEDALNNAFQILSLITKSNCFFLFEKLEGKDFLNFSIAFDENQKGINISGDTRVTTIQKVLNNIYTKELKPTQILIKASDDFGQVARSAFYKKDIKSCAVVPLHIDNKIWGTLLLANPKKKEEWEVEELDAIRSFSFTLSNFLARKKMENGHTQYLYFLNTTTIANKEDDTTGLNDHLLEHTNQQIAAAEQALKESEQRLELAVKGANLGIWDWNLGTGKTIFNAYWAEMLGFEVHEIEHTVDTFIKNIHPDDRNKLTQAIQNHVLGKTTSFEVEFRMRTKTGEWKWIYDRGKVVRWDKNGLPLRASGTHMDITDRKITEKAIADKIEELNEKNQQLQQYIDSNMQLENFAYIASHDMREPLRTVSSFAELLKIRYSNVLDQAGQEYLDFIMGGAKNMNQLIEDLLTYSRVNNQDHTLEEINIQDLLALIKLSIGNIITEKKATLTCTGLPTTLIANRTKLKQLFQNLIVNAIKFHQLDTAPIVQVSATEQEQYWRFEVKDNGIGIDEEFHEKIFLLFKKLHGKKEYQGTGIGLALCKKIAEQHGGEIWVESKIGSGTSFFFTIRKENL